MTKPITEAAGTVEMVFAHRFVLKRADGTRLLADLGPSGATAFRLVEGAVLSIEGEAKPSEMKVFRITPGGGEPIVIEHGKTDDAAAADRALAAVRTIGLEPLGEPRRKPKHVEVLVRRGSELREIHVAPDGTIAHEKPADRAKWSTALALH